MIPLDEVYDFIATMMLFVAIWAQIGSYVITKIQVIVIQTTFLAIYAFISGLFTVNYDLIILAFLIIFIRGIFTAYILMKKLPVRRELIREKSTTVPSIIIVSIIVLIATLIIYRLTIFQFAPSPITAIGFVIAIQGLLLIGTRKNKITQFTGYIEEENAMILLSLGIFPLPLIVEISVLLDVLALVIVAAVLLSGDHNSERMEELIG
jgi:hydrogenase-4 component E